MPNVPPARNTDFANRGKLISLTQETLSKIGAVERGEGSYRQGQDGRQEASTQVGACG